jgi:hypothetical protein
MLMVRARTLLLTAVAATLLGGCFFSQSVSPESAPGVSLAGNWKVDAAASDDPQKTLNQMRDEASKIISRNAANAANAQARGATAPPGTEADDPVTAHGPRRDPLQHSPMAHIIQAVMARGEFLSVQQRPGQLVFDYGSVRRTFTPGAHSVVSVEGGVADQTSGWHGDEYVILVKPQNGPEVEDRYSVSGDRTHLTEKLRIAPYELPGVTLKRVYDATSESTPRQPTSD